MAEGYRGAPTRIGRVILAVFGAPFILASLTLVGIALFGRDATGEKLAMVNQTISSRLVCTS